MSWHQPGLPAATVMPLVEAHRTPHGVQLVRRVSQGVGNFAIRLSLGLIFLTVGAGLLLPAWFLGAEVSMFLLFGGLAAIGGLALLVSAGKWIYHRTTLEDATLDLPHLPLRLGDRVTARFTQRRKGNAEIRSIGATLTCQEWVRYRQGTDTRTDTHQLWSQPLPAQPHDPLGDTTLLKGTWLVQIPPTLPPSFAVSNNAVQWLLTVRADVANRPDIVNTYTLPILPEVVRDLR